jgi:hypothetical protein
VEVKDHMVDQGWILGAIYGDAHKTINRYIWERIEFYALNSTKPVCIIGDFNVISKLEDKWGGSRVVSRYMRDFNSMIVRGGFIDLGYNGSLYTWTNRRRLSGKLIMERLDRAYATVSWIICYSNTRVYHLPRFNSDHNPLLVTLDSSHSKHHRQFRMENWLLAEPDFKEVMVQALAQGAGSWNNTINAIQKRVAIWSRRKPSPDVELQATARE